MRLAIHWLSPVGKPQSKLEIQPGIVRPIRSPFLTFSGFLRVKIGVSPALEARSIFGDCFVSLNLRFFFGLSTESRALGSPYFSSRPSVRFGSFLVLTSPSSTDQATMWPFAGTFITPD